MRILRFGSGLLIGLAVLALLLGACGPKAAPPPPSTPVPGGNQPPVISSLQAAQMQLYPSGNTEIQCIAADADGDQLDFKWAATGGEFSGYGPIVIWKAPPAYGTYTVTVTISDGKGGSAQSSLTMTVGANQSPIISSLVANPASLLLGASTTVTCVATDPDGDVVRYSWTASEGSISGVGNRVTWIAPNKGGNFNVTVVVSDGKGGETRGNLMIPVSAATKTVTLRIVKEESGTVDSDGDKDNSRYLAGDDDKNVGYCAFWSYDIWSLQGANVSDAKLKFTLKSVAGDPFSQTTGLKGLRFWAVKYGDKLPKFQFTGTKLERGGVIQMQPPTIIDVTPEIAQLAKAAATRFQVEALFMLHTNGNNVAEFIEWTDVELEVTYSGK
ncbi:MAG: PKD domain-containing protein [Chloroflexi bacterium]|nr:PKD domain-containing protein [Chloroflexota bacterium]MBM4449480.1 PKD domain-containing protein [Chloroflexota bacterium]